MKIDLLSSPAQLCSCKSTGFKFRLFFTTFMFVVLGKAINPHENAITSFSLFFFTQKLLRHDWLRGKCRWAGLKRLSKSKWKCQVGEEKFSWHFSFVTSEKLKDFSRNNIKRNSLAAVKEINGNKNDCITRNLPIQLDGIISWNWRRFILMIAFTHNLMVITLESLVFCSFLDFI